MTAVAYAVESAEGQLEAWDPSSPCPGGNDHIYDYDEEQVGRDPAVTRLALCCQVCGEG